MYFKFKKLLSFVLCLVTAFSVFFFNASISEAKKGKAAAKPNVVVVLDPGHDSTHEGCHYENFDEATANLYIAYYCKQELEKYAGVTVYMTRTTFECPFGADPNSKAGCLSARVDYAKSVKADILVSLHNDYDPDLDTTQNGAKVIIPNPSYKPALCAKGQQLGKSILDQLVATGLNINNWKQCPNGTGIVTKDSSGATYPDGSPRDFYALINQSKSANMTCVIVEHAFCTNYSDRVNHLSTPEQYQQLGVADATGIANFYGLKLK
ncbi:MAG: N-acetylmuramoyl-L-alanine amidase [Pseudobutyrivibrio sp.]|nr:N-acetylmuramoyl-L-alanine amidase [Pseudobutyrivibrio sp.]